MNGDAFIAAGAAMMAAAAVAAASERIAATVRRWRWRRAGGRVRYGATPLAWHRAGWHAHRATERER